MPGLRSRYCVTVPFPIHDRSSREILKKKIIHRPEWTGEGKGKIYGQSVKRFQASGPCSEHRYTINEYSILVGKKTERRK